MDLGRVISQTFAMVFRRFWGLLGLFLIFLVIQWIASFVGLLGVGISAAGGAMTDSFLAMGFGAALSVVIFYGLYFLLYFAQSLAMTHYASALHQPSFGDSLGAGLKTILTTLGLTLIFIAAYLIVFGSFAAIIAVLGQTAGALVTFVLGLAAFIAFVWLSCRLALTLPVVAIEGERNPLAALGRSWQLTRGHALMIFLTYLAFGIAITVLIFLVVAISGGSMMSLIALGQDNPSAGATVFAILAFMIGFFLVLAVISMLMSSFMAALHAELAGGERIAETFA